MGKARAKPSYTLLHARRLKERLLPDQEIYNVKELEELTVRRRKAMWALDSAIKREQREFKDLGTCPVCHIMLTTEGECQNNAEHTTNTKAQATLHRAKRET